MPFRKSIIFIILSSLLFCNSSQKDAKIGIAFLEEGKQFTAYRFFEKALENNKDEPLALYGKGKIFLRSSETVQIGRELIRKSLPKLPEKHFNDAIKALVHSHTLAKEYRESIALLQKQIEKKRESDLIYKNMVANYLILRKYEQGKRNLQKALDLYPTSIHIMQIAGIYESIVRKNKKEALKYFEAVSKIDSKNSENLLNLAIVHNEMRNYKESVNTLIALKSLSKPAKQIEIESWIKLISKKRWKKKIQIHI